MNLRFFFINQVGQVINSSRISPLVANARRFSPDGSKLRIYVGASHVICLTSIALTYSYIYSLPASGLPQ